MNLKNIPELTRQLRAPFLTFFANLQESDTKLYNPTLETLRTLILTSTSSMTSVPKPLKYLRPLYPDMVTIHDSWPDNADKVSFYRILLVSHSIERFWVRHCC